MKIYLQGLGLANAPVKLLFTGHVGSGKSTTRNKLAEEIKRQFFIVSFDARQSLSMAGLSREDYPILYERYQDKLVSADEAVLSLLQTRPLLEYANGYPWCDVHPIALPLVLERTGRLPAVSP